MKWPLLILLLSPLHLQHRQSVPLFRVSILFNIQPSGYTLDYRVSTDSLTLDYNCSFLRCRDTTLYRTSLTPGEAFKYYSYLRLVNLDSLRNINETTGFQGVSTLVKIRGKGLKSQTLLTVHPDQAEISGLISRTNSLISDPRFRYKPPPSH